MIAREWKPGDVALVEVGCWANRKVALRLTEGWSHENGVNVDGDGVISVVRPLVVIDPEDREAVERLADLWNHLNDKRWGVGLLTSEVAKGLADDIQTSLRQFADPKPPKPEEPMGLGAVVEDAKDCPWVRGDRLGVFCWTNGTEWRRWDEIDAVKVLSEGVTGGAS